MDIQVLEEVGLNTLFISVLFLAYKVFKRYSLQSRCDGNSIDVHLERIKSELMNVVSSVNKVSNDISNNDISNDVVWRVEPQWWTRQQTRQWLYTYWLYRLIWYYGLFLYNISISITKYDGFDGFDGFFGSCETLLGFCWWVQNQISGTRQPVKCVIPSMSGYDLF